MIIKNILQNKEETYVIKIVTKKVMNLMMNLMIINKNQQENL